MKKLAFIAVALALAPLSARDGLAQEKYSPSTCEPDGLLGTSWVSCPMPLPPTQFDRGDWSIRAVFTTTLPYDNCQLRVSGAGGIGLRVFLPLAHRPLPAHHSACQKYDPATPGQTPMEVAIFTAGAIRRLTCEPRRPGDLASLLQVDYRGNWLDCPPTF